MDDFIDDSEADPNLISDMIREITGYDKRKFRYEPDDDDDCMETSAFDQMREEEKSLLIGILYIHSANYKYKLIHTKEIVK